ncbi:hypothetical protein [Labilibaculum sp.]|uniref:hypothetical protein n=1 Tax=Labilibaculum sp. TaxID=2060723 RepID=UPI003567CFBB
MKKLILFIVMAIFCSVSMAQQEKFLVFEFMKVKDNQDANYWETETFWEKIHAERVKNGEIKGWDLWSLKPGGAEQAYQYVTVTIYNDAVSAMEAGDIWEAAKRAYPLISDVDLENIIQKGDESRELSKRMFVSIIAVTDDDFEMELGSVMKMNFMDVLPGKSKEYETAEKNVFLPKFQKLVDKGILGHWALARVLMPSGSKVKTTHLTFDMYDDFKHYFEAYDFEELAILDSKAQLKEDAALKLRDLNWTYVGVLVKTEKFHPTVKK